MEARAANTGVAAPIPILAIAVVAELLRIEGAIGAESRCAGHLLAVEITDGAGALAIEANLRRGVSVVARFARIQPAIAADSHRRAAARGFHADQSTGHRPVARPVSAGAAGGAGRRGERAATAAGVERSSAGVVGAEQRVGPVAGNEAESAGAAGRGQRGFQRAAATAGVGCTGFEADGAAPRSIGRVAPHSPVEAGAAGGAEGESGERPDAAAGVGEAWREAGHIIAANADDGARARIALAAAAHRERERGAATAVVRSRPLALHSLGAVAGPEATATVAGSSRRATERLAAAAGVALLYEGCREQVALADERATEAAVGELGAGDGCNARQAGRQQEFDRAAAEVGAERCAADGIAAGAGCHARFAAVERAGRARRRIEERTAAAGVGRAVADAAQGATAAGPAAIVAEAAALAGQRR